MNRELLESCINAICDLDITLKYSPLLKLLNKEIANLELSASNISVNAHLLEEVERLNKLVTELSKPSQNADERDAKAFRDLRKLMGYIENSSETTVKLSQDDATGSYFTTVGKKYYYGQSLYHAIDQAISAHTKKEHPLSRQVQNAKEEGE